MSEKLHGIVINVINYNDKHNIAHIFTLERGRLSFLVRKGSTGASRRRAAMFLPLSLIEFEGRFRAGSTLGSLHDVSFSVTLTGLYGDPAKNAIAMFMSELLARTLQEEEPSASLFSFLSGSVLALDEAQRGVANFHLCFLYRYGQYLGIQPDVSGYDEGYNFDLAEGVFTDGVGEYSLPADQGRVLQLVSRMTYDNMRLFKFSREQRNQILDLMLEYYRLHHSTVGTLRSPAILKQLFA